MSVISSKFADELNEKEMRDAYVQAQTRVKLAHQIRSLRTQRKWSQGELGERLGKPQSNVSRLEDADVGKYTLSTLLELASAFDVAVKVEFASYPDFLESTADLSPTALQVKSFDRAALQPLCEVSSAANTVPQWLNVLQQVQSDAVVPIGSGTGGGERITTFACGSAAGYIVGTNSKPTIVSPPGYTHTPQATQSGSKAAEACDFPATWGNRFASNQQDFGWLWGADGSPSNESGSALPAGRSADRPLELGRSRLFGQLA